MKRIPELLGRYKYLLLALLIGLALLALPTGSQTRDGTASESEARLERVLGDVEGVGECRVLLSQTGVVVVCEGGGSAAARLDIVRAVCAYTGLASDRITVLKLGRD